MIAGLPLDPDDLELDDPLGLLVGRVRELVEKHQQVERGKPPAARRARFGIPAGPSSSRLRSSVGLQTFHFAINQTRERTAGSFDRYSTEKDEAKALADERARPATTFDAYAIDDGGDGFVDPPSSVITTLDPDSRIRQAQWDEIERHERALRRSLLPGPPRINIRYERDPQLLLDVAARADCPSGLRSVIMAERDRVERGEELPARLRENGVAWISDDAPRAMKWLQTTPRWQQGEQRAFRCAKLSPGRGVVTVIAGEIELPDCLDEEGRAAVLRGFSEHVQGLITKNAVKGAEPTSVIPFLAVEHRPGPLNDRRNPHLHFQIGTRGVSVGSNGELAFDEHKVPELAAKGAIYRLRSAAARLINVELERLHADFRLSPKTYAELGIEAATQIKLHGERTVLERAGVPTDPGIANAAEGWRRAFAQAQDGYALEMAILDKRDLAARDRTKRELDGKRRQQRERERAAAYEEAARVLELQLEVAEIRIHIAMARSRSEQTSNYAPGYADKARRDGRDTWDTALWRKRGKAADVYLGDLDHALSLEHQAMAERTVEAERLTARANARYAALEKATGTSIRETEPSSLHPARAVTLIAERGLYLSRIGDGLGVQLEHDPDRTVQGVDLSGQGKRLEAIRTAQERELMQLRARVRKHGWSSLGDELMSDSTAWMQAAARRWRGSSILRQMVMADVAMAQSHAELARDDPERLPFDPAPRTIEALSKEARAELSIQLAPKPAAGSRHVPNRSSQPTTRMGSARGKMSELERRFVRQRTSERRRERQRVDAGVQIALRQRAGDAHAITPHGARLLARLRDGFEPTRIDRRIGITGRTLDQRDADEILLLMRDPIFAKRATDARNRVPALLRHIDQTQLEHPVVDKLARVSIADGKVRFNNPAEVNSALHAPSDLALQTIDRLGSAMPRLSRHTGIFGIYDRELLEMSGNNYVGLLDPAIQHRLEAIWRVQREEERALLSRIARRQVEVVPIVDAEPTYRSPVVWVDIRGATEAERRIAERSSTNPYWHVACNRASHADRTPPERHADPIVRALLRASDVRANPAVVDQLVRDLRAVRPAADLGTLTAGDRKIVNQLLQGRQPLAAIRTSRSNRPALQPGREPGIRR